MKTRKNLLLILVIGLFAQIQFAQQQNAMQGADKILFADEKAECLVFAKFVVTSKNLLTNNYKSGEVSQKIEAFKRLNDVSPQQSCLQKGASIFSYESTDEINFANIDSFGDLILIDLNLTPDSQKIVIFDGSTGKKLFADDFTEWGRPARLAQNSFFFDDWTSKEGSEKRCPQAKKWKKDGLGVNWIQPYKLNLKTMKKTINGLSYCVSVY